MKKGRRDFLKTTLLTTAGAAVSPNIIPSAFARSNSQNNKINVGVIGCGIMGFWALPGPGVEPYIMKIGDRLSLSFRILIHQGDSEKSHVKLAYNIFENPPQIKSFN